MHIELSLDGQELLLDGKLIIPMNMQGLLLLRNALQAQKRTAYAAKVESRPISPASLERVCHCGRKRGANPCEGCPGELGAGKVQKLDAKGKEVITLEDLGLL